MMQFEPPKSQADIEQIEEWLRHKRKALAEDESKLHDNNEVKINHVEKENLKPSEVTSEELVAKNFPMRKSYSKDGEALLFKLGDEHKRRKKMYEKDVKFSKGHYDHPSNANQVNFDTNLSKEADQRQSSRKPPPRSGQAYFEVTNGGDIFARRPSSAQVRAQRKQVYRDALEAQLASQKQKESGRHRMERNPALDDNFPKDPEKNNSVTQHPSYNNIINKRVVVDDFETIRVPTPQEVRREPQRHAEREVVKQPSNPQTAYYDMRNVPPNYAQQPQSVYYQPPQPIVYQQPIVQQQPQPTQSYDRLNSTLERATYEMELNRNRLENESYPSAGYGHGQFAPPPISNVPNHASLPPRINLQSLEKSTDRSRRVQINEQVTPRRYGQPTATDHDIFNTSASFGARKSSQHQQRDDYARDLQNQMRDRELKKRQEKDRDNAYEAKLDREAQSYDPFGRGGGGAPVKDKTGNIMADLRHMRTLNNTVENNLDQVFELKDTQQNGVTTPRPPSHNKLEALELEDLRSEQNTGRRERITEINEPRKKTDYNYRDYLEDQIRQKEKQKRDEKEKQRMEDERLEERIRKDQEILQREKEIEDAKTKDSQSKSGKPQEQSFPAHNKAKPPPEEYVANDTAHKVQKSKAKVLQLDEHDWQQKHDQLGKQIREAQIAKARAESRLGPKSPKTQLPRTPIPRTPAVTNLHVAHGRPPIGVRESAESRMTIKSKSENVTHRSTDKRVTVKSSHDGRRKTYSRARESSSLSDISWDVRSQVSNIDSRYDHNASRNADRNRYEGSRAQQHNHQPVHQPPTRVMEQINQLKKTLQDEYMRIQQNLDNPHRNRSKSMIPHYPQPQYSLPPRGSSGREPRQVTDDDVQRTTESYLNNDHPTDLTADELKYIKNDNDELGLGRALDDETMWLSAPGDTFASQKVDSPPDPVDTISTVPPPSTTDTFDIDHHERLNQERTRQLDEIAKSFNENDAPATNDQPNGIRQVNNSAF